MSNDRHTADIAKTMGSAMAQDERNERRETQQEDRRPQHLDDQGHLDAREMSGRRRSEEDRGDDVRADERRTEADRPMPMFAGAEAAGYRTQWDAIQTGFVDEPRKAVQEADALVQIVMRRLSDVFGQERASLEKQWGNGDQMSTEELRVSLRRYRSFFERLLSL